MPGHYEDKKKKRPTKGHQAFPAKPSKPAKPAKPAKPDRSPAAMQRATMDLLKRKRARRR